MEGPQNIPGATPQLSFISAKKVLYGFQKKVAADREADTFDTHHHQTCPRWVLMHFGPLSKVLGHPQNVTPSWVWQLLHEHTWHGQSIGLAMALLLMGAHQTCSRFPQASPLG